MKKIVKITMIMSFCLIFWGSNWASAQTITTDSIYEFVCFRYDNRDIPSLSSSTITSFITKDILTLTKRPSWEDIMLENEEFAIEPKKN